MYMGETVSSLRSQHLCRRLLRLLRPVFRSTRHSVSYTTLLGNQYQFYHEINIRSAMTHQIHSTSDQMIPHTRTILTSSPSHQNHRVLLHIMPLSRNIARNHSPCTQTYSRCFSFCRIGFLGLCDSDFEADSLQLWGVDIAEGWRHSFSCALLFTTALDMSAALRDREVFTYACDLVVCSKWGGCCGEVALEGGN